MSDNKNPSELEEQVRKARAKCISELVQAIDEIAPLLTDAEFTDLLELVDKHRIRRLSMKIAVPWKSKTEANG